MEYASDVWDQDYQTQATFNGKVLARVYKNIMNSWYWPTMVTTGNTGRIRV